METQHVNRYERIDVLRGIAILLVILHHYHFYLKVPEGVGQNTPTHWAVNAWVFLFHQHGYLGVQLFFVLSGFCIHNSYLNWRKRTQTPTKTTFLASYINRRFWRIYPPFLIVMTGMFVWLYFPDFDLRAIKHYVLQATLLNTLSKPFFYNINPAFWSVAVECQLYILYPALLWFALRAGVWKAFLCVFAIAGAWRFILPQFTDSFLILHLPFRWWMEWGLGFLIAELHSRQLRLFAKPRLTSCILVGCLVLSLIYYTNSFLIWILAPLAFGALLQVCCDSTSPLSKAERGLYKMGIVSYSLYLLHNPILWILQGLMHAANITISPWLLWIPCFVITLGIMYVCASLFYRFVEIPSIRIGRAAEARTLEAVASKRFKLSSI